MAKSIRFVGRLIALGLLSGALAVPLWADEVTVTVPPDDAPAQAQSPADDPTAHATDTAGATTAQAEPAQAPAEAAPAAAAPATAQAAPAAPVVKKHKKAKTTATATPPAAAQSTAEAPAAGADPAAASAKPAAKKTKTAKASCLNLTQETCGSNDACIWVSAGTDDAGKATKARCRSLAILKREADKQAKAAKSGKPEVLPWATGSAPAATGAAPATQPATTASVDTKPVKKKVAAKKAKPATTATAAPAAAPAAASTGDAAAAPPATTDTGAAGGAD